MSYFTKTWLDLAVFVKKEVLEQFSPGVCKRNDRREQRMHTTASFLSRDWQLLCVRHPLQWRIRPWFTILWREGVVKAHNWEQLKNSKLAVECWESRVDPVEVLCQGFVHVHWQPYLFYKLDHFKTFWQGTWQKNLTAVELWSLRTCYIMKTDCWKRWHIFRLRCLVIKGCGLWVVCHFCSQTRWTEFPRRPKSTALVTMTTLSLLPVTKCAVACELNFQGTFFFFLSLQISISNDSLWWKRG